MVAIAATLFLRQADATVLNQNFTIETLYGNPILLDDVFEINAIRQEGTDSFSRVVLTSNEPEFIPISFDARHRINDRQLENREFYRGTHRWQRNNPFETENFQILIISNWPNPSTFHILNRQTGDFIRTQDTINTQAFNSWSLMFFVERDANLYVISAEGTAPNARVYTVDFQAEALNYSFSVQQTSQTGGAWFVSANNLYFYEMGGWVQRPGQDWEEFVEVESGATGGLDPETGEDTLTPSERSMYAINFDTQSFEARPSPTGLSTWSQRAQWGDYVILDSIATYDHHHDRGYFDGISIVNLEEGYRHVFQNTNWNDWFETQQGDNISSTWWSDTYVIGDYLVEATLLNQFLQFITIYDLTTMTRIYHGRINLRRDQGLLRTDWGNIYMFEVGLRTE